MRPTPEAACGRFPLEGAAPTAWQSQIRGPCMVGDAL
jgi:hypothetical protein